MRKILFILPIFAMFTVASFAQEPVDFKGGVFGEPSRGGLDDAKGAPRDLLFLKQAMP